MLSQEQISVVECCSLDLDDEVVGARIWRGDVGDFEPESES